MSADFTPLSHLTNDELLNQLYTGKSEATAMEIELGSRLEALMNFAAPRKRTIYLEDGESDGDDT